MNYYLFSIINIYGEKSKSYFQTAAEDKEAATRYMETFFPDFEFEKELDNKKRKKK